MTRKQKTAYYILLVLVSALFVFSSVPKLLGQPMQVAGFATAGLPAWFMYVIGAGELFGAIGLWFRPTFRYAYEGLYLVLAGATVVSAVYVGLAVALLPIVTGIALGFIVKLNGAKAAQPQA